jgi:hypothetical protein
MKRKYKKIIAMDSGYIIKGSTEGGLIQLLNEYEREICGVEEEELTTDFEQFVFKPKIYEYEDYRGEIYYTWGNKEKRMRLKAERDAKYRKTFPGFVLII